MVSLSLKKNNTAGKGTHTKYADIIALCFSLAVYAVFNLLLVNKFFPITEGWFQDAANYINGGQAPYKDFYMFVPPGFPLITSAISSLSDNMFLAFRLVGFAERLLMLALMYRILRRLFSPMVAAVSGLTGAVVYIANIQEIFYGYYQTSLFIGLIGIWLCIRMYETFEKSPYIYAFFFGFCAALSFMVKQTLGLLLSLAIGVMFLAAVYFIDAKKAVKVLAVVVAGCATFFAAAVIIMAFTNTLLPFVEQVFGGASSKGSLVSVLFGFIPRILTQNSLTLAGLFLGFYAFGVIKGKCNNEETKKVCDVSQWVMLLATAVWLIFILIDAFVSRSKDFSLTWEFVITLLVGFFILGLGCIFMCFKENSKKHWVAAPLVMLVGFAFLFWAISSNKQNLLNYSQLRDFRQHILFAIFLSEFLASVYLLYRVAIRRDSSKAVGLIICVASWSIMYVHGFSYTIEDHSGLLSVSLFIGYLLSASTSFKNVKQLLALVLACGIVLTVFYQRNWFTYHWWGVNMTNTSYDATETFDDPHLKGIYANKETTEPMNEIYHLVEQYKNEDSTLYSFPHIAYFNVMAELPSPTFAKTHYFDVCSDSQAESDAAVLLENPPDFIVWMEMPEETWVIHEDAFRGGEYSGQRSIQQAYRTLTEGGDYTLLGVYHIYNSDPIYLWINTELYK